MIEDSISENSYDEGNGYFDDDDIYEECDDDILYEPDELSKTKYNIVLCELYNGYIHGNKDINTNSHYLTVNRFKKFNIDEINSIANIHLNYYRNSRMVNKYKHMIIRNYKNIVTRSNYIKPEIAECLYLNGEEEFVSILKTLWIRLIQRTWKKIYKIRQEIFKKRCKIDSILYREIHGKWPIGCNYLPSTSGMLSYLSNNKRDLRLK